MTAAFDVVVLGAGPAGAVTALELARRGLAVALLGRRPAAGWSVGETLAGRARPLLEELGLWEEFTTLGHEPAYALRSVWGSEAPIERSSIFDRYGPGWHLDRTAFDAWLCGRAERAGAALDLGAHVRAARLSSPRGPWELRLEGERGPRALVARRLVDATGRAAWLTVRQGAQRFVADHLVAVVRWFSGVSLAPVTVVEAVEGGWWYSAPLPRGGLVAAWMTDPACPEVHAARSLASWTACLAQAPLTRARLAGGEPLEGSTTRLCGPTCVDWSAEAPYLPVGDAAAAFDPLSGAGLCFALRSALEGARALAESLDGHTAALARYQHGVRASFDAHLVERRAHYALERRFPDARFWRRRSALR